MDARERFKPVEFKVLVKPDHVEQVTGNIIIPDIVRDRQQISQDKATIISVGGNAFEDWQEPIPKIGDRVLINRHSGYVFKDKDDNHQEYRVINDKDITMILEG